MGRKKRLAAALLLLVAAASIVWWFGQRGATTDRAAPAHATQDEPAKDAAPSAAPDTKPEEPKPAEPPKPEQGLRVRVVAEGKPVTDAKVHATADDDMHSFANEGEGAYFAGATGKLTVGVAHARFGPARRDVKVPEGAITEVTVELPAGETLDVLALSDRGTPVAGALVYVIRAGGPGLEGPNQDIGNSIGGDSKEDADFAVLGALDFTDLMQLSGLPAAAVPRLETDANGRARIEGLPKGTVDLVVAHKEFVATRLNRQPVGREAVARLSAGGSLTVLAPYVDGRAPEGCVCGAIRPGLMLSMPVAAVKVDAEGKAFFPHLPPGPLKILVATARHPMAVIGLAMGGSGWETDEGEAGASVAVGEVQGKEAAEAPEPKPRRREVNALAEGRIVVVAGEHRTLDLRERKGARIDGVFVAGEEERKRAAVLLLSGGKQIAMKTTGEEGTFVFEGVEPGSYCVRAAGSVGGVASADVEVKEGDSVVTVRIEFPAGAIAGRILGVDGKPVAGRVLVAPRDGSRGQATSLADLMEQLAGFAEADAEGRFRVQGLAAGEYRVLGAVGSRLDTVAVTLREREEVQVELRVDDARVRRLLVKLRGPDGPVEGTVSLFGADGGAAETLALALMDDELEEPRRAASHEFFLAPGRYRIVATAPGLAPLLGEPVEMSGDRDVAHTFVPGVRVELALEGPDGPLANRELDIRNEHGIRLDVHSPMEILFGGGGMRTDGAGVLTVDAVPPGRYTVALDGKERARFEVGSTSVTRRIRLE